MKILSKIKQNAQQLLFVTALSVAETYYILKAVFELDNSLVLACLAVFIIAFFALIISMLPKIFSIPILLLTVILSILLIVRFAEPISAFLKDANAALYNIAYIQTDNPAIVTFVLAVVTVLTNWVLIFSLKKNIPAAIISIILICIIYYSYDYISTLFLIFYLAVILLILIRWSSPQKYNDADANTTGFLFPFIAIFVAVCIVAPISVATSEARIAPLQWIDDLDWFVEEVPIHRLEYVVRIDGQSKLTNLSNEFDYTDSKMMTVISPYFERLRNKTYDTYTRFGWEKAIGDKKPNQDMQYSNQELMGILELNAIEYNEYDMTIKLAAHSQMIFAPLNSVLTTSFDNQHIKTPYDDLFVEDPLVEGTEYSLQVLDIDYKSPTFIGLITSSTSDNIDNMENYLDVPEKLKNSLKPMALGLTKNVSNNYEKAKIIESYLSSQFSYTLYPPEKPENMDFVEYFLFETKQGFCTHYATSMVLMLRSIDVPCRYVTGYLLDAPVAFLDIPYEIREQTGFVEGTPYEFNIQKQNSHAWVEVWFDDFGWLTFEPTSKYLSPLGFASDFDIEYADFENFELVKANETEKTYTILFIILGSILLLALILAITIKVIIVSKRTDNEKISALWDKIKKTYYKKRKITKENETARQFYMRADSSNDSLKSAMEIYEHAVFSNKDIALLQMAKMNREFNQIKTFNRKYKKMLRENK